MFPATNLRVPLNTADAVNDQIRRDMLMRVERYRDASPEEITARLHELDEEWDIERTLEANAAMACMLGVALGTFRDRRFFYFPLLIGGFLFQHALQGWCPPLPIFRRLGVRTAREIDEERYALKMLRGDFELHSDRTSLTAGELLHAVERS